MLTLHRASATIVTDESFSVKLKWVNPCCYMDSIPGDVGLGLEISVNEYTRAEFGNPERFEKLSSGSDSKFPDVSVRFSGALLMAGTLVITSANRETYSGWLQSELGVLGTKERDRKITDMDWKKDVTFENKLTYDPLTDHYATIELENKTFWDGHGAEAKEPYTYIDADGITQNAETTINAHTMDFRDNHYYLVNNKTSGSVATSGAGCVVSPFIFLKHAVTEAFRKNGFFVSDENNALDEANAKFVIYNNFNIFRQVITTTSETHWEWDPVGNGGRYVTLKESTLSWIIDTFNYSDLLPAISFKEFILGIQNFLNIVFRFSNDREVKVINRNEVPDAVPYDLSDYFLGHWSIGERKDVTLKFIPEPDSDDEMFSQDWHDLSERLEDFKDPVQTKTQLDAIIGTVGDLRMVRSENMIYEYKWYGYSILDQLLGEYQVEVADWVKASRGPQPYFFGTAEEIEPVESTCSTLARDAGTSKPVALQHGNLPGARSLWSDFSLRLLDYGGHYPPTLDYESETGLFETRWKKWATFWKNRLPVEGEFSMPLNELYYVINNITQPYSTRHGKFLIEEMECDFEGDRMGTVKIKGYKL